MSKSNCLCYRLPYTLGTLPNLKAIVLDGNPMKSIRRDIMMVGYILFFILVFLVEWFEFVFFVKFAS